MWFGVITLFPAMLQVLEQSICGRAIAKQKLQVQSWDPRDFTQDKHRRVDDRPYGGGPGMVLQAQPLVDTIAAAKQVRPAKVVYLSPQGKQFTQKTAQQWLDYGEIILLCGRYEGIDERVIDLAVDEEWSLGDFILTGGELAALAMIDSVCRLIPGVLGDPESSAQDSFTSGLLDYPHYTRPAEFKGLSVPDVLRQGDHDAIRRWRLAQALKRTWLRKPALLTDSLLTLEEQQVLNEIKATEKLT